MTPCQKIKRDILLSILANLKKDIDRADNIEKTLIKSLESGITADTVDAQYDTIVRLEYHWDYESGFREGDVETKLPCEYSRHFEAKSVAMKVSDGTWVGWTYWYGGGKHGNPEAVKWMEDAYNLEVVETEKVVIVREFKKV